jgi:pantetheine-phosphate adenylyltransferase
MNKKLIGIFPGTFDPITFGHIDIIKRSLAFCDELIIGIVSVKNSKKNIIFSDEERFMMISEQISNVESISKIKIKIFDGLLVDFAKIEKVNIIIRGLRPYQDFDFEFKMACINRKLNQDIETVFLTSLQENQFISSSLVKEVAVLGGDIEKFLPENIAQKLKKKLSKHN